MRRCYTAGYGDLILRGLARRDIQEEAPFFLPHLKPDMRLLDCGCGPGSMTVQLAHRLFNGQVVGIDIEGTQLQIGRDRARKEGLSNICFQEGNVYALPFEDGAFDAAFVHAVLYHLVNPEAALAEICRVLKPGGLLGVRDSDLGGTIVHPTSAILERAWSLMEKVMTHGGAALAFGRTHRAVLRRIGFECVQASASYDCFCTQERTRGWSAYCRHFLMELHSKLIIEQGWVCEAEMECMALALRDWGENPDAFFARSRCEAVAWKPRHSIIETTTLFKKDVFHVETI